METLRIRKLEIANYLRIEALTINCDGKHVVISGPNASGKTSAVQALFDGLKGCAAGSAPDKIHDGAKAADITIELGGKYVVTRHITAAGAKLTITDAQENRVTRPQELLDGLLCDYALDPAKFLTMTDAQQIGTLLDVTGIRPPVVKVKVKEIIGEEIAAGEAETAFDYLKRLIGDNTGALYLRRRDVNRVAEQKALALKEARQRLAQVGGEAVEGVDVSALNKQISEKHDEWRAYSAKEFAVREAKSVADRALTAVATAINAHEASREAEKEILSRMEELQRCAAVQFEKTQQLMADVTAKKAESERLVEAAVVVKRAFDAAVDPSPAIAELQAKLESAGKASAAVQERKALAAEVERIKEEERGAAERQEQLTSQIEQIRGLRESLIDTESLGVANLTMGDGELLLNGRSFNKCASFAERLRVACAIGMREKPHVRILRIDNGEHLDGESKKMVFELAEKEGFQVFMTAVADSKGLVVEVVDKAVQP